MKISKKKRYAILIIIWLIVVWGHSMMPGEESSEESALWLDFINRIMNTIGLPEFTMFMVRKLAHFTEYMILAVFVSLEYSQFYQKVKERFYVPAFCCWFAAFMDETIQLFSEGRAGMIQDVWIDFSGACVGVALTLLIIYNKRKQRA